MDAHAPTLTTARLRLRPFVLADAADVCRLAGERAVALPTAAIPHPYPEGAAEAWIAEHPALFQAGRGVSLAITLAGSGELLGTMSLLDISRPHARAEVGYWVGLGHWGQGYGTEALRAVMAFGEQHFQVSRFVGRCLASNAGSARVLLKAGFVAEGRQVQQVRHPGGWEDMLLFGRCTAARQVAVAAGDPA
ncbi:MAG: GNAT family N-acetyltransferase [Burkholderiales bacterium PBB4]|nr:MAG: GNAT family N-acetyltransferase [Burkholderiales bacterium PBB4]